MFRELFHGEYLLLEDWLVVATKGLSAESATRVSEEIQEHYERSVAALIAEGYRPGGAELESIKRLGSPYRARRRYKREYPRLRELIKKEYLLLEDWLAVATNGLSDESITRVAEEIAEHYQQSVEALVSEGYRHGDAELEAITRLGSPYRARREYKREYPTLRDMKGFERYLNEVEYVRGLGIRPHWREILCTVFLFFVGFVYFSEGSSETPWFLFAQALLIAGETFAVRSAITASERIGIRQGYRVYLYTACFTCWPIVAYFGLHFYSTPYFSVFLLFVLLMFFLTVRTIRIWRKVGPFLVE